MVRGASVARVLAFPWASSGQDRPAPEELEVQLSEELEVALAGFAGEQPVADEIQLAPELVIAQRGDAGFIECESSHAPPSPMRGTAWPTRTNLACCA